MKLFKSLLVAPATLGLLAPMAATANEVTVNDFNPVIQSTLLAGGEGLMDDDSYDGGFSETTTASFSADMAIGAVDGGTSTTDDAVEAYYGFQIDLNTSFTGEDSLDISLDAGNAGGAVTEFDLNGTTNEALTVDGVSYTFPLGDATVFVGDNTDGSALFSTACVYGGPSNTLDDCGNVNAGITGGGTAFGASLDFGNGFTGAVGYAGTGSSTSGLLTEEGLDSYGANVAYTGENYGVSITYGMTETDEVGGFEEDTATALNAYYTPESFPASISFGYEFFVDGSAAATADESTSYFIGLQFDEVGPGTLGTAFGTKTPTVEETEDLLMYEVFYSYPINDGMTITPLAYIKEFSGTTDDETGVMVKTSFSF